MREGEHMAIGSTDPEIIIAFRTFVKIEAHTQIADTVVNASRIFARLYVIRWPAYS